jgi:hypothetical protein
MDIRFPGTVPPLRSHGTRDFDVQRRHALSTLDSCPSRSPFLRTSIADRLHAGMLIALARNFDRNQTGIVIGFSQEC